MLVYETPFRPFFWLLSLRVTLSAIMMLLPGALWGIFGCGCWFSWKGDAPHAELCCLLWFVSFAFECLHFFKVSHFWLNVKRVQKSQKPRNFERHNNVKKYWPPQLIFRIFYCSTMAFTTRTGQQSAPWDQCACKPCEAVQYGHMFIGVTDDVHGNNPPKVKCKMA